MADLPAGWSGARFRCMGCTAHVVVAAGEHEVDWARAELDRLEQLWSRFLPTSEISALHTASGRPVVCHPDTLHLLACARDAWRSTGGAFDPTAFGAVAPADAPLDALAVAPPQPAPGLAGLVLDAEAGTALLPPGVAFDPGGIGKGLAADLVAERLVARGAASAMVNVGGDLRVIGPAPWPGGWGVRVDLVASQLLLAVGEGGVATSAASARAGEGWHHLLDPRTGRPVVDPPVAVCVHAPSAWRAETLTKLVTIAHDAADLARLAVGGTGVVVADGYGVARANEPMAALLAGERAA